jgi:hypothetical protein
MSHLPNLEFTPCEPLEWRGRYGRIPGNLSVFHVRHSQRQNRLWPYALITNNEDRGTCWALKSPDIGKLVQAVQSGKQFFGHPTGGSFLVNEYGQVLVPASSGDRRCAYVGSLQGKLQFDNPLKENTIFDLSDDHGLTCGTIWERPYVGSKHNWSVQHGIHFRDEDDEGKHCTICPHQDNLLIAALQKVRSEGYIRFIVNPHGLVLTKKQIDSVWKPIYVGRVNYKLWFAREE